jgi:hypothetical protein
MRQNLICVSTLLFSGINCGAAPVPQKPDNKAVGQPPPAEPSLALSPAVITLKAQAGASSTHPMTITNLTYSKLKFVLEAFDVVVRHGDRVFVPAGETEGGIARSAIFAPPTVEVNPGESAQVKITLTVPAEPKVRAVVAIFHGQTAIRGPGALMVTGSLGALITYNLSEKVEVHASAPMVSAQTESTNLTVSEQLDNVGREPVIPKGTLAILRSSGQLVGRVAIESHRLLPGEKFKFTAEYPHLIRPGQYRAMMSFEYGNGVQTNSIELRVQ